LASGNSKKIFIIFLVVFIDLLGFGIVIPLLPPYSENVLHLGGGYIGLVIGIFSLMQFIFNPFWGRLSDIYGRKPIIVFSLIGNVLSYILLGLVFSGVFKSEIMLFVSRAMAGFFSANIGAAMAYISDVTTPEERSKGMGLIGAAFGLGFIFGPFIGGVLANRFDYGVPAYLSALLSFISLLFAIFMLKESLTKEHMEAHTKTNLSLKTQLRKFVEAIRHEYIGLLIVLAFVSVFSIANIFATLQLFAESSSGFKFNIEEISYLFAFMGFIGAMVQGVLIRPILKYFDEKKVYIVSNLLLAVGLGTIPLANHHIAYLLASITLMGAGNGLSLAISSGLISKYTRPDEQGGILGLNQSLSALARFLGPAWGGFVYQFVGYAAPFLTGGIIMLIATFFSLKLLGEKYKRIIKHD
jgi:MFS family permease